MRIVRLKSLPHVDITRLLDDRQRLHDAIHTADGLRDFSEPRRTLILLGIKGKFISAEIAKRGGPPSDCQFCQP
jgi:hypothetical protein